MHSSARGRSRWNGILARICQSLPEDPFKDFLEESADNLSGGTHRSDMQVAFFVGNDVARLEVLGIRRAFFAGKLVRDPAQSNGLERGRHPERLRPPHT